MGYGFGVWVNLSKRTLIYLQEPLPEKETQNTKRKTQNISMQLFTVNTYL